MALLQETSYQYYESSQVIVASAGQSAFTITLDPVPSSAEKFLVYVNDIEITSGITYVPGTGVLTLDPARAVGDSVNIKLKDKGLGKYRYVKLNDIINNYLVAFVGDGKIIDNAKKTDIMFHAKRGIQEFSYDVSRIEKIQETEVGPGLSIPMPQDYVGYTRLSWVDGSGIERLILPARFSSRPSESLLQDEDYNYLYDADDNALTSTSVTGARFNELDPANISGSVPNVKISHDIYDRGVDRMAVHGARFGLSPEFTQENGYFIIDEANGTINFSSDMSERLITLKYISDGLGSDDEMQVHKFAEDAIYKYITHAIASSKVNMPEYIINRFRKERRAAMRTAKIRLSNLKTEEITQVMRGKSKQIK
tara:strand:+ start:7961 stop:9061 length:1101 start_codon:yes stop_codon:yes gene_type:complete